MVRAFFTSKKSSTDSIHSSRGSQQVQQQQGQYVSEKAKAVLLLLRRKGPPLSAKQLDYCNEACIGRVLKAKGNNVKKAAKQLRATLAWRAGLDVDYLTADEFSAELAWGNAYVAGLDEEGRPVLVVRLKPEITTSQAQKQFIRYFVFTMEVAIACMPSTVEQCVLIVDAAAFHKKSFTGFSIIVQLLKLLGEHYPERLARSFIADAPFVFHYLWKGMSKILDLKVREKPRFVFSKQYKSAASERPIPSVSATANHLMRAARSYSNQSLWAAGNEQMSDEEEEVDQEIDKIELGSSKTSRNVWEARPPSPFPSFSFSTSSSTSFTLPSLSSLLLSSSSSASPSSNSGLSITSSASLSPLASMPSSTSSSLLSTLSSTLSSSASSSSCSSCSCTSSASSSTSSASCSSSLSSISIPLCHHPEEGSLLSDKVHARSLSFASVPTCRKEPVTEFRSFRADCQASRRLNEDGVSRRWADLGFGQRSEDSLSHGDHNLEFGQKHKSVTLFRPYYINFLHPPYMEAAYRARMKPPLAGLISIISPDLKFRQPSFSLHSTAMEAMLHHLHFD